jgi:hypothetical protein
VSAEEEQGVIGVEEEPCGPQRTSSGLVSTQRSSKLKRVSSPGEDDAATPVGAARGSDSLLTIAKREAARRMLYSKFYRGEVLRGEYEEAVVSGAEGGERKKKRKREEGEGETHPNQKKKKQKEQKEQPKDKDKRKCWKVEA